MQFALSRSKTYILQYFVGISQYYLLDFHEYFAEISVYFSTLLFSDTHISLT